MSDGNENVDGAAREAEIEENHHDQATTATPILNIVSHGGSVKITDYDGRSNWRLFKAKFDRVSRMNGWENSKTDYLWVHLASDALSYAEDLPNAHDLTYDELCQQLGQRFDAQRLTNVHKAELINRRRRPGETLSELGQSIRQLVNYAHPNFNQAAKEETAIEKFLDALKPELRRSVYQESPQTLNEAIERGLKLEAWNIVEDTKHGKSVRCVTEESQEDNNGESEQIRLLKDLQTKVENLEMQRKSYRDVQCFYCKKNGHIARDCHSKRRDEGQQIQPHKPTRPSTLTCFRCGGRGHRSNECATPARAQEN